MKNCRISVQKWCAKRLVRVQSLRFVRRARSYPFGVRSWPFWPARVAYYLILPGPFPPFHFLLNPAGRSLPRVRWIFRRFQMFDFDMFPNCYIICFFDYSRIFIIIRENLRTAKCEYTETLKKFETSKLESKNPLRLVF